MIPLMNCPKCTAPMNPETYYDIEIDRCSNCSGFWFDTHEKHDLLKKEGIAAIDEGNAETGKIYNRVDRIDCPRCKTQMIRMVDAKQPHIWHEECTVCGGSFLDAGEFRDLAEETFGDFVKSLFRKQRP